MQMWLRRVNKLDKHKRITEGIQKGTLEQNGKQSYVEWGGSIQLCGIYFNPSKQQERIKTTSFIL